MIKAKSKKIFLLIAIIFAIILFVVFILYSVKSKNEQNIWKEFGVNDSSEISNVNMIRSNGGQINSWGAQKYLSESDKKTFYKLISNSKISDTLEKKYYSVTGFISQESYFSFELNGERKYIKWQITTGKIEEFYGDETSGNVFSLNERETQELFKMFIKYNPE